MVKTAILIGGYARAGKSTAMGHLTQSIPTSSTSQMLAKHVKLLIPYLEKFDFTSDVDKAVTFPVSTAYVATTQIDKALISLGIYLDYGQLLEIYKNHHQRFVGHIEVSLRDICIAVAESTRLVYPNIYVDLALAQLNDQELVAIETIGGAECDYLYAQLKAQGYQVTGQNIRRKTELAGVDIREPIKYDQCDILNRNIHNDNSIWFLRESLDRIINPWTDWSNYLVYWTPTE